MHPLLQLQHLERPGYHIELFVPDAQQVQNSYLLQKLEQADVPFPHWAKLWPSALAMADYIFQHPELVQGKQLLELAAGLGLPSFIAARYAKEVCCSDYLEEAVDTIARSAWHLELDNVISAMLDWNDLPDEVAADVLLLSDINYDPEEFEQLYNVLLRFLREGSLIILTTPQRLMAKPFIERLLPFCVEQEEMRIDHMDQQTPISIFLLKKEV